MVIGFFIGLQHSLLEAVRLGEEIVDRDPSGMARAAALAILSIFLVIHGDLERGAAWAAEGAALNRALGNVRGTAWALHGLGHARTYLGDEAVARAALDESYALFEGVGDAFGAAHALLDRGEVDRFLTGDRAAARDLFERAAQGFQAAGVDGTLGNTLGDLGYIALEDGDAGRARDFATESLRLLVRAGFRWYLPDTLELCGCLASVARDHERAARLFGAAWGVRQQTGAPPMPSQGPTYERHRVATRTALGEPRFAAEWERGQRMSLELVTAEAVGAEAAAKIIRPATDDTVVALTTREREVAGLVARGYSNRHIAEALVISEGTAGVHVHNILGKLGFSTRAQVAAWAAEHGLVHALPPHL
jgi:non-specific serine/threonine protein kinase